MDRIGAFVAEAQSLSLLGVRAMRKALGGVDKGSESSLRKLVVAEHDQRVQEFGIELLGAEGATTVGDAAGWTLGYLATRCLTIAGGTSEVQRNVIGERILGLPRDA
jgi:alkylation response protein AidB-like acyl-CoA dehydrogenase